MEYLNITQLPGGSYSHANQAVDLGGKDTGKDYWYARGETYWKCTCCWYSGTNTYHFLSCDANGNQTKVHCADGVDRVVTVSLTHDLNAPTIGKLYHNEKMFQEGTKYPVAGKVTGNHIHLEIAEGDVRTRYKGKNGTWTLYNELNPLTVMFVDDSFTTVKNTQGATVQHCDSITSGGTSTMASLANGYQKITYSGATMHVTKGYGDYKQLYMLSAKGGELDVQDIQKFDHNDMVIIGMANCNYFEMSNASTYGQHYGVEQSDGDGEHSTAQDLAPKNSGYRVVYQTTDGEIHKCLASDYWYSKKDVIFACTPYSIVVWDGASVNETSTAFGNKDSYTNSQTMYMYVDGAWAIVATLNKVLPSLMRSFALSYGAKIAFLVDSGGSTQEMTYTGGAWKTAIYTGRKIPNVLVLAKKKTSETVTPTPDANTGADGGDNTSGDGSTTVSKEEYEKVVKELEEAQSTNKTLQAEIEALQTNNNTLNTKINDIKTGLEELSKKL